MSTLPHAMHGSCLSFPFRPDQRGTLATVADRRSIVEQSIRSIIETRQGERVMMPDYGIPDFVFSVIDAEFAARLAHFIEQQVRRYEPLVERIKARPGSVTDSFSDQQRAAVIVEYTERGSNVPRNLIFPTWALLASATTSTTE